MKVSWGIILALFAMIMIYTGGTQAIQNLLIIAALPFSIVIILMIWSLFKSLSIDHPRTSNKFQTYYSIKVQSKRIENNNNICFIVLNLGIFYLESKTLINIYIIKLIVFH